MRKTGANVEHAGGAFPFGTPYEIWLTAGEATAAETAEVVVRLLVKFANMAVSETTPFLHTFGLAGRLSRVRMRG
jgi:hypothetical protein